MWLATVHPVEVLQMSEPKPAVAAEPVLPPFTTTVSIEHRTAEGKMLAGDFTFKRLTIVEVGQVGAMIARLNGGNTVDSTTDVIHTMMAELRFGIVDAPKWWDLDRLYEVEVLRKVWEAFMAYQKTFRPAQSE